MEFSNGLLRYLEMEKAKPHRGCNAKASIGIMAYCMPYLAYEEMDVTNFSSTYSYLCCGVFLS